MQAQHKLFIVFWSAVVVVVIGLMAMFYASMIPHFKEIGDWAVWVARLILVCFSALAVAFTVFKIVSMYHESKFVQRGDTVTYLGTIKPYVVSAEHEAAKIPRLLPAPDDEPPFKPTEQDIINIYNANKGVTLKQLGAQFQMSYGQVEKIYAEAKKRGLITR